MIWNDCNEFNNDILKEQLESQEEDTPTKEQDSIPPLGQIAPPKSAQHRFKGKPTLAKDTTETCDMSDL